ncbi:hypothetical protein ACFOPX_05005 [Helicobacter baculiformis]|uniref:OMP1640 n=1 Tax=Helicobacter baculiformis TaxID=427351 RepID=A0A1M4NI73_9HELI|nr:hypothetical protein [Helicobacter baculiformis]SFZ71480.1 OMP1640 [Helicobacter baculiformis]
MNRLVEFGRAGVLGLYSRYGALKWEISSDAQALLKPNGSSEYYKFEGEVFNVCAGEKPLYYLDYPLYLDFGGLDLDTLGAYLCGEWVQDGKQSRLIKQFLEVYDRNISKNCLYLDPPYFSDLDHLLARQFHARHP